MRVVHGPGMHLYVVTSVARHCWQDLDDAMHTCREPCAVGGGYKPSINKQSSLLGLCRKQSSIIVAIVVFVCTPAVGVTWFAEKSNSAENAFLTYSGSA